MSDTPRTDAKVLLCNYGEERVCADFSRGLERELFAFKRSCERIIQDHNDRLRELRYAENMLRQNERELNAERARLDWLLNITQPPTVHTSGWPYPDTRGTYGYRFIGRVYYESCEGRPEMTYFKDRAAIDAAMASK